MLYRIGAGGVIKGLRPLILRVAVACIVMGFVLGEMTQPLAKTPLHAWHCSANASMAPFAGFEMPVHYGSIVTEHHRCRNGAVLFDVSHMGRLRFEGDGAAQLLDHLLTRQVVDLAPGRVRYALVCDARGGILDDVLVSRVCTPAGNDYFLLVVNAANRQKLLTWMQPHLADFPRVTVSDRTEITAMIAIQGPRSLQISSGLFKTDLRKLRYYRTVVTEQFSKPVIASRTGYTGEDGLELIVRAEDAQRIWSNLMLAGRKDGICAAGLGARDTLRMEAGMPLYGHELDESINPFEAGLEFACDLEGRSFIADDSLQKLRQVGTPRIRVGLFPEGTRPIREGANILDTSGASIGRVTSGGPAPTLSRPIAMAIIDRSQAAVGTTVVVDNRGRSQAAVVCPLPFYKRGT